MENLKIETLQTPSVADGWLVAVNDDDNEHGLLNTRICETIDLIVPDLCNDTELLTRPW